MSLEQTVSEKCLLERHDAIRSKCRGNCRSSSRIEAQGKYLQAIMERAQKSLCFDMNRLSGSLEATRAQLTDFDLPPSGLMGNGQSGLRREELGAEGGAVAGTHQGSSGEMLGGSQNPNAGVGNQLLESDSALAETSDAVMVRIESMLPTMETRSGIEEEEPIPEGGSESSVLHAAARNGDLTTVESICNANPSPSILEIAIPGHLVIRFLCKNKADVGAAMDDTTAIHFAAQGSYYPLARPANRKALTPLHYAVQGSHLELIEYLVRKGASVTAMTKAGQTPIDRVSTEEVRALLVECKQPLTKDDKSTTILEVGDSVSKEHIKENNGGSFAEETANVDEEGVDTKEKRRGEAAADEDSSKPRKAKEAEMLGGSQNPNAGVGNQLLESDSALAETSDAVMVRIESMLPTV
ncbi:Ankyrin repeat [Musa troglodytarum]|uniref:Ankyrin repeat n=1 Tax=Musa troglodytarum TaxID=320322 RepID=A0A9E7JJR0_9LILI|nr:Ankyrin repeat [Musa troglodytarum]